MHRNRTVLGIDYGRAGWSRVDGPPVRPEWCGVAKGAGRS
jgi:hypothetical protein